MKSLYTKEYLREKMFFLNKLYEIAACTEHRETIFREIIKTLNPPFVLEAEDFSACSDMDLGPGSVPSPIKKTSKSGLKKCENGG